MKIYIACIISSYSIYKSMNELIKKLSKRYNFHLYLLYSWIYADKIPEIYKNSRGFGVEKIFIQDTSLFQYADIEKENYILILIGNDFGMVEISIIDYFKSRKIPIALMQDGYISHGSYPKIRVLKTYFIRLFKRKNYIIELFNLRYSSSSLSILKYIKNVLLRLRHGYGTSNVNIIFAMNKIGVEYFNSLDVNSKIVLTGQPRFDNYIKSISKYRNPTVKKILIVLSDWVNMGIINEADYYNFLNAIIIKFKDYKITFRPHPSDTLRFDAWDKIRSDEIKVDWNTDIIDQFRENDFGFLAFSTMTIEAAMCGFPFIVFNFFNEIEYIPIREFSFTEIYTNFNIFQKLNNILNDKNLLSEFLKTYYENLPNFINYCGSKENATQNIIIQIMDLIKDELSSA